MDTEHRVEYVDNLHDYNVHVPNRIVYFGKKVTDFTTDIDDVDGESTSQAIKNLLILDSLSHKKITLYLSTSGGDWDSGVALYDIILSLKSPVTVVGLGKIYSMGSVIIQAGTKRLLSKNTFMMLHDGSFSTSGDSKSSEAWAENSKEVRRIMYKIFYDKMKVKDSRLKLKNIEDMCSHDTILNATTAISLGLADRIL